MLLPRPSFALYAGAVYVAIKHPEKLELAAGLAGAGVLLDLVETSHDIRDALELGNRIAAAGIATSPGARTPCGCKDKQPSPAPTANPDATGKE